MLKNCYVGVLRTVTRKAATETAKRERVGIIGLGNVGRAVAGNILKSKEYKLSGLMDVNRSAMDSFDVDIARHASAATLAKNCDIVVTCLPEPPHVKEVIEGSAGVLQGIRPKAVWIDHSTTEYEQTIRLTDLVRKQGADALEAPVTGGMALLKQGLMTTLVGGNRATFDQCQPLLKLSCANVIYMGEMGSATIAKVISNQLAGAHLVLTGEALALARRGGVDLTAFFTAIRLSAGNSYVFETEAPLAFNGTFQPDFSLRLHCKDFNLGYKLSRKFSAPQPLMGLVEQIYNQTRIRYGDEAGSSYPMKLYEESINVNLREPGFDDWTYEIEMVKGGSIGVVHKKKEKTDRSKK